MPIVGANDTSPGWLTPAPKVGGAAAAPTASPPTSPPPTSPPPAAPPGGPSSPSVPDSPTTSGGITTIMGDAGALLTSFGFTTEQQQTLSNWYTSELDAGKSQDAMNMDLWSSPQTKPIMQQAFPGIVAQMDAGQKPMSVPDYVTFQQDVTSLAQSMGLPANFIGNEEVGKMVAGGITVSDLTSRISDAKQAAATIADNNPQTAALLQQWYGVKPGDGTLAAYFLDPTKTETLLQNQYTAANIGGGLEQAGFTQVDKQQLLALAGQGVSASTAQAASAAKLLPATTPGVGMNPSETISQSQAVAATLGGPGAGAAQLAVSGAESARGSKFSGGGGYGTGTSGTTGAGAASE